MEPDIDVDDSSKKDLEAAVWGRAAGTYSRVGPPFFQYFGKELVRRAPIEPGDKILDVAAGRGAVLFPAAEKVGASGLVMGTDFSEGMVQETGKEIAASGVTNAQIRRMDAERLAFADASFDCVLCGFAIFFFPHLDRALAELRRVLKPGGALAVTTWGKGDERWAWLDEMRKGPMAVSAQESQTHQAGPHFETPEGMKEILARAGFVNVEVVESEMEFLFADEDAWWATLWSHGARLALENLPPQALERAKAFAYSKMRHIKQPNGIPTIHRALITVATKPGD